MLRETFLLSCVKCKTLLLCHRSVKRPCWTRENGLCLCAGTCLLSRSNRTFPPDVWLVMTPVRRWWSPILSSVSTSKLFSHLAPETTDLTGEITVYPNTVSHQTLSWGTAFPHLLIICMSLCFIILRCCFKTNLVCVQGIMHSNKIMNRNKQGMPTLCASVW